MAQQDTSLAEDTAYTRGSAPLMSCRCVREQGPVHTMRSTKLCRKLIARALVFYAHLKRRGTPTGAFGGALRASFDVAQAWRVHCESQPLRFLDRASRLRVAHPARPVVRPTSSILAADACRGCLREPAGVFAVWIGTLDPRMVLSTKAALLIPSIAVRPPWRALGCRPVELALALTNVGSDSHRRALSLHSARAAAASTTGACTLHALHSCAQP